MQSVTAFSSESLRAVRPCEDSTRYISRNLFQTKRYCLNTLSTCNECCPTILKVAASGLFSLDSFEQRLEVALAEAAAALSLNDFKKQRRTVLYRLGEDLQHVPFIIAIN